MYSSPSSPPLSQLLDKRHDLIPGGAHTYSKGDDQFPEITPKMVIRGNGALVWGSDGKEYLDWCMGLRSVILGHVHASVNDAVVRQMEEGTNFGRPHPIEFALADRLTALLPGVEMVKFTKNGSTSTTAATKLARAYTGKKIIACCADHPFFSYDDWFIGTTACDAGIPEDIKALTKTFRYNDFATLEKIFTDHPADVACVIMEAVTIEEPKPDFLEGVQELCRQHGAVFIVDEMITGFRWHLLGASPQFRLSPDLVTYGKGIANGYSVSVLGGKKEIMKLGGLRHDAPRVFLVSTTHGAETVSLAAALATIDFMEANHVAEHLWEMGEKLKTGLLASITKHRMEPFVSVVGFAPNLSLVCRDAAGNVSQLMKTVLLQEVVKRGILFQGYFAISFSHGEAEIARTIQSFDETFGELHRMLNAGSDLKQELVGEPCKPVFRKYN